MASHLPVGGVAQQNSEKIQRPVIKIPPPWLGAAAGGGRIELNCFYGQSVAFVASPWSANAPLISQKSGERVAVSVSLSLTTSAAL